MNRVGIHLLLNNTGIVNEKDREYMGDIAREIHDQIEANISINHNDVMELIHLASRAAKYGTKDGDFIKILEDVYELLKNNEIDDALNKLKIALKK